MIFGEPIERVVDDEATDSIATRTVEIDGAPPGRPVLVGIIRAEFSQVIAFRANVVVNNVKDYRQALVMARVHESFQPFRAAIG